MMRQLTPEEQTADALAHSQTNILLDEVLAYLKRLPQVPTTRELIDRVEAQRQQPANAFARNRAEQARQELGRLTGSDVWPKNGEPPLYASLELDNLLVLTYRDIDRRPQAAEQLLKNLAARDGHRIQLEPSRT